MTDPRPWRQFSRTLETVTAAALAEMELAAEPRQTGVREAFVALAAAPSEQEATTLSLKNGRRDLQITLTRAGQGVALKVEAFGYRGKRTWSDVDGELVFEKARLTAQLRFGAEARAEAHIAEASLQDLARDKIALFRVIQPNRP